MTEPIFITCSIPEMKYGYYTHQNLPVNIHLCHSVMNTYTLITCQYDNSTRNFPCIRFLGVNLKWVYPSTQKRDKEYDLICHRFFYHHLEPEIKIHDETVI